MLVLGCRKHLGGLWSWSTAIYLFMWNGVTHHDHWHYYDAPSDSKFCHLPMYGRWVWKEIPGKPEKVDGLDASL